MEDERVRSREYVVKILFDDEDSVLTADQMEEALQRLPVPNKAWKVQAVWSYTYED